MGEPRGGRGGGRKEGWNRVNESPDVEGVPEEGNIGKGRREGERLLTVVERVDRAWVAGLANANMLSSR